MEEQSCFVVVLVVWEIETCLTTGYVELFGEVIEVEDGVVAVQVSRMALFAEEFGELGVFVAAEVGQESGSVAHFGDFDERALVVGQWLVLVVFEEVLGEEIAVKETGSEIGEGWVEFVKVVLHY